MKYLLKKKTHIWVISEGKVTYSVISPEDFGLPRSSLSLVRGGNSDENALLFKSIVNGEYTEGPILDFILMNTSAVLFISDLATSFKHGVELARIAITSGSAKKQLETSLKIIESF